ncbi:unnamed protein product [Anisakis simplex]|uniref:Replication protein A subunit n=1 Tax=Anisakis simplex TaxID=6269 RepID=A0A0M3JVB1_ANISI|nr:unnamed protein product [Anisakis simplex]
MLTVKDLTSDFFQKFFTNDPTCPKSPVLQVIEARMLKNPVENRHRFRLSDGVFHYSTCTHTPALFDRVEADKLSEGHPVIRVLQYSKKMTKSERAPQGRLTVTIDDYEVLGSDLPVLGQPVAHSGNESDFKGLNVQNVIQHQEQQNGNATVHQGKHHLQKLSSLLLLLWNQNPTTPNKGGSFGGQNITPIRLITPYVNKWRICGVVTAKEELRVIRTAQRGELKVFNFEITDEEGGCIRVAAFAEMAEKFYAMIQKGSMYYVMNGNVKQANKRFNTTGHDYELSVRQDTDISPCVDRSMIAEPKMKLSIVPLSAVPARAGQCIDVLAIIDQISELQQVTQRSTGALLDKRDIHLIDTSGTVVVLTLWGEQAKKNDTDLLHQVVGIKGASVREYNGSYNLSAMNSTRIEVNPDCTESRALYVWFREKRPSIETKYVTSTVLSGDAYARDLHVIGIAKDLNFGQEEPKGAYFNVTAMISSIKTDGALYKSCGTNGCKKKVIEFENGYRCEKCDLTLDSYKYVLLLSMEIADFSGLHWVTVFEEKAYKLLNKTAEELGNFLDHDQLDEYNDAFSAIRFRQYTFRIRAKSEVIFQDAQRIKWTVFDVHPVDYDKYANELTKAIEKLESL